MATKNFRQVAGGSQLGQVASMPDECQLCGAHDVDTLYDARLRPIGTWALVCESCFNKNEGSLGIGRGQKYERV